MSEHEASTETLKQSLVKADQLATAIRELPLVEVQTIQQLSREVNRNLMAADQERDKLRKRIEDLEAQVEHEQFERENAEARAERLEREEEDDSF